MSVSSFSLSLFLIRCPTSSFRAAQPWPTQTDKNPVVTRTMTTHDILADECSVKRAWLLLFVVFVVPPLSLRFVHYDVATLYGLIRTESLQIRSKRKAQKDPSFVQGGHVKG